MMLCRQDLLLVLSCCLFLLSTTHAFVPLQKSSSARTSPVTTPLKASIAKTNGDEESFLLDPNENDDEEENYRTDRWHCPVHEDICRQTGVTLSRYMMELARLNPELEPIESIFTATQVACKAISKLVRTASLQSLTGLHEDGGSINVQGEEQKKMDVLANDVLKNALKWTGKLGTLASEEEDTPMALTDNRGNEVYSGDVLVDTDGSYIAVRRNAISECVYGGSAVAHTFLFLGFLATIGFRSSGWCVSSYQRRAELLFAWPSKKLITVFQPFSGCLRLLQH
jgi:hypothetical protein